MSPPAESDVETNEVPESSGLSTPESTDDRYDFRRSSWLTQHRIDAFQQASSEVARHSARLLADWNAEWSVTAGSLQAARPDGLEGVDWFVLDLVDRGERGVIVVDHEVSLSILVHLCGDPMRDIGDVRPLSPLESSVVELVLQPIADAVVSQLLIGSNVRLRHEESATMALGAADDSITSLELRLDTGERQGSIGIGVPSAALRSFAEFVDHRQAGERGRDGVGAPEVAEALGQTAVPVVVHFDPFDLTAATISALAPGDVIKTGHPVHRPLVSEMGGTHMHLVEPGQQGERLVVTVVDTPDPTTSGAAS